MFFRMYATEAHKQFIYNVSAFYPGFRAVFPDIEVSISILQYKIGQPFGEFTSTGSTPTDCSGYFVNVYAINRVWPNENTWLMAGIAATDEFVSEVRTRVTGS